MQGLLHEVGIWHISKKHRAIELSIDQHVAAAEHRLQRALANSDVVAAAVQQLLPHAYEEAAAQNDPSRRDRVVAAEPSQKRYEPDKQ